MVYIDEFGKIRPIKKVNVANLKFLLLDFDSRVLDLLKKCQCRAYVHRSEFWSPTVNGNSKRKARLKAKIYFRKEIDYFIIYDIVHGKMPPAKRKK